MSKSDFVQQVSKRGGITNAEAKRIVELVLGTMEDGIKKARHNGRYAIGTFGIFTIAHRAARIGRNPKTGEAIQIKASKTLRFKPSAQLKKAAGA